LAACWFAWHDLLPALAIDRDALPAALAHAWWLLPLTTAACDQLENALHLGHLRGVGAARAAAGKVARPSASAAWLGWLATQAKTLGFAAQTLVATAAVGVGGVLCAIGPAAGLRGMAAITGCTIVALTFVVVLLLHRRRSRTGT
jgi:hypothetical protein